ncbi:MAG: hypothetical protein DRN14_05365 [Thermoplasmata archaeon]|nr:MAG: hypothetical protein DRN14_05365 [Thermoplasmata archaeon]
MEFWGGTWYPPDVSLKIGRGAKVRRLKRSLQVVGPDLGKRALILYAFTLPLGKTLSAVIALVAAAALLREDLKSVLRRAFNDEIFRVLALLLFLYILGLLWSHDLISGLKMCKKAALLSGVYLLCFLHLRDSSSRERVLLAFVGGVTVLDLIALMKFLGVFGEGAFQLPCKALMNHIWFGNLSALSFYLALLLAMRRPLLRALLWGGGLIALVAVLLSTSRGVWLALLIVLILWSLLFRGRQRTLAIVVLSCLAMGGLLGHSLIGKRVEQARNEVRAFMRGERLASSVGDRLAMWYTSWQIFLDHPFIGAGTGDYEEEVFRKTEELGSFRYIRHYNQPHNIYLHALVMHGLVGLGVLLGVFALLLKRAWVGFRSPETWSFGAMGISAIVHTMVAGFTEGVLRIHVLVSALGLILGCCLVYNETKRKDV